MTNPLRTHHVALKVADLDSAEKFYAELLNLPTLSHHNFSDGSRRSVWLNLGGTILMLEKAGKGAAPAPENSTGWHLLALAINAGERNAWKEKLQKAGVKIESESEFSVYFRDPEGNRLALSHHPAGYPF